MYILNIQETKQHIYAAMETKIDPLASRFETFFWNIIFCSQKNHVFNGMIPTSDNNSTRKQKKYLETDVIFPFKQTFTLEELIVDAFPFFAKKPLVTSTFVVLH